MDRGNKTMNETTVVIAIDGPAASGKSTVASELARLLGYGLLNSGDIYRAMTWACLGLGIDCRDSNAIAIGAGQASINVAHDGKEYYPHMNNEDPRAHLRDPEVNANVSLVSAVPAVRNLVTAAIRASTQEKQTVIEGRDIGSAVFPETPHKFYIDADPQVRQRRRRNQGQNDEIAQRDTLDSTRSTAPLTVADGATVIDSSALDVSGVVEAMLEKLCAQGLRAALIACNKG